MAGIDFSELGPEQEKSAPSSRSVAAPQSERPSGGILAEGGASNGDDDEQNRADRSNGIEGDSRSAA